jgi:cation:H+ antiporter
MALFLHIAYLIVGLAMLYYGAEWLVAGSSRLALRLGITPLAVGLTVVAFGTSAPELSVGIQLNLADHADAAVGNVVGSNICNLLLILGLSGLFRPLQIKGQIVKREMPILILASFILVGMLWDGQLSRVEGGCLVAGILGYLIFSFVSARKEGNPEVLEQYSEEVGIAPEVAMREKLGKLWLLILAGLVVLVVGSKCLETGGLFIARAIGVSEAIIGLTLLAVGTSLPELATSIIASLKGEGDIIAGNAVGSCIFNIFAILGITILVRPMVVSEIRPLDLGFMVGAAVVVVPLMINRMRLGRLEGALLLGCYAVYMFLLAQRG